MVVNTRRCEIEIIREILSLATRGAKKTQILYKTNLSYTQLQEYLSFLLNSHSLEIEEAGNTRIYRTTSKGLETLKDINKILDDLQPRGSY
ncbi:MAG TPA: DUF4364 domain-containing protein [Thermoplasmata archaeon]|nr:DUF4364 domain-containing protein [Thermoplasmata archaeon]